MRRLYRSRGMRWTKKPSRRQCRFKTQPRFIRQMWGLSKVWVIKQQQYQCLPNPILLRFIRQVNGSFRHDHRVVAFSPLKSSWASVILSYICRGRCRGPLSQASAFTVLHGCPVKNGPRLVSVQYWIVTNCKPPCARRLHWIHKNTLWNMVHP